MTLSLSILAILPFLTRVLAFSNSSISPMLKVAARYLVGEIALIAFISLITMIAYIPYDCFHCLVGVIPLSRRINSPRCSKSNRH